MAKIVFYDTSHRYTVDGEEVPSVSELTRFITREVHEDAPQLAMDKAADRGTKVHKATESIDKYGSAEIEEDIAPYLQAYVQFLKDYKPDWEKIEWAVNNGTLYAGTLDRYGTLGDKKVILDIKTTGSIGVLTKVLYTAAQNLYRMAIESENKVDAIYILQLKKDGKYRLMELEIQNELAEACITLHLATKKRKRKENAE
jgi:hypothetical protein